MADPNSTWTEMVTFTIENRRKTLADNVSDNNALLKRLTKNGKADPVSGGRVIAEELEYGENDTFGWYSGYETLDISPQTVFSAAEFAWKQAYVAVTISGLEMLQNSGKEAQMSIIKKRVGNAERTFSNQMSVGLYSDGTAAGGKQIGGLNHLIGTAGNVGTPGGIDKATWAFWNHYVYDFSVIGPTPSATTIQAAMNLTYLSTSRGPDHVDLIVADNTYYGYYWASLQSLQRFGDEEMAAAGFSTLKFMGADVVFDGGIGGACPANTLFFLNTNYLYYRPHADRNIVPADPENRYSVNQDALVKLILWAGNATCSNMSLQGRIQA
jgi:hypothetical protein